MSRARLAFSCILLSLVFLILPFPSRAQVLDSAYQTGLPLFGTFHGGDMDVVSLQNFSLHAEIPILSIPQRGGHSRNFKFVYETPRYQLVWIPMPTQTNPSAGQYKVELPSSFPLSQWLLTDSSENAPWSLTWQSVSVSCTSGGSPITSFYHDGYVVSDPAGTNHQIALYKGNATIVNPSGCPPADNINKGYAIDGSGIYVDVSVDEFHPIIRLKDGTIVSGQNEDTNGNLLPGSAGTPFTVSTVNGQTLWTYTDPNGQSQTFTVTYTPITIHTSACTAVHLPANQGCSEFSATRNFPQEVTLPNGASYQFSWVNNSYGQLQSIALPTGGSITYAYSAPSFYADLIPTGANSGNQRGSHNPNFTGFPVIQSRTVSDGITPQTWTYAANGTVTLPTGDTEVHTTSFQPCSNTITRTPIPYEVTASYYQGSGTSAKLLKTVAKTYTCQLWSSYIAGSTVSNVSLTRETTTLDNGLVSKVETDYDSFVPPNQLSGSLYDFSRLNVVEKREFAFGSGAPGALLRRTHYTYLHDTSPAYVPLNIVDRPASVIVYDGSSNMISQTTYEYDVYNHVGMPAMQASGAIQHDGNRTTTYTTRGNRTAASQWRNTDGALLTTLNQYDDAGNLIATKDPIGNLTQIDYTDAWVSTPGTTGGSACAPIGQLKAFPTTTTNALNQVTTRAYYSCSGQLGSITDPNNLTTYNIYDLFGRTVQVHNPDNGFTKNCFTDAGGTGCTKSTPPFQRVTTKSINSATSEITTSVFDGLGRLTQTQLNSDPQGAIFSETTYDPVGRVATVSNPHRSTGSSTDGITTYAYDPLGRTARVTLQDGSFTTTTYFGNITTVTDPAGKSRKSVTDALGRLTQVFEDPSGLNFETDYSYDALNNLLSVVQVGSRQRSFVYNSLSQLTQATNPESGTINYTYDADGNLLTKQDARSITTTYSYDTLNRLTQKSYSDGTTPSAFFAYDGPTNGFGVPVTNVVGRLTEEWTGTSCCASVAGEIFGYDPLGRIILNEQYTPSTSYIPVNYTYDLVGDLLTATNGEGVTISYSYDSADRPTAVTSSLVDSQHPATLATVDPSVGYYPTGAIRKMTYGNGLTQAVSLQPRLQPCRINLNSSGAYVTDGCSDGTISGTIQDFDYAYGTWGTTNNGNVTVMDAVGIQNFGRSYTYDSINRIATMSAPGDSCSGLSWTFDSWGNRTSQTATGGSCYQQPSTTFSAKNQLPPPYQYDAAGNMTYDGTHTYTYDAENRLTQVDGGATATYVYDANGNRVQKTAGGTQIDYVYDLSGNVIAEINSSGWLKGYAYLAGQTVAEYFDGTTYFVHSDHLGSTRLLTGLNQAVVQNLDYLPYGELTSTNSGIDTHKFTGKERDTESGNDYFGARYYASSMGRFLSPDWSAKVEPVPYSKLDNPQTLNLYAYVGNNPLSRVDPTGHADIAAECKGQSTCNKTLVQTVNIVHQAKGKTVVDSTLSVTTKFSLTTDAKGNVSASASSTVANVSGLKFSDSQLATMGKDIGTMQQAAVGMGFGQNTTELVTAVGAAESHFGASPSYAGAPNYMNPAINPMQLTGGNGANTDLNHNVEGGMGILDWAGRPSTFDPTATYTRYSDHSPTTMSNWNAIYGSINETQP